MKVKAKDQLHVSSVRSEVIRPGEEFEVSQRVGKSLVDRGLVTEVRASRVKKARAPSNKQAPAPDNKRAPASETSDGKPAGSEQTASPDAASDVGSNPAASADDNRAAGEQAG